jgi:very-short-patch-repair endonuclease
MTHEFVPRLQRGNARRLRRDQTDVERKLWRYLRANRFEGLRFKRQAPMGRYIVDFVSHEAKVVVELDGGQHGFHTQAERDRVRDVWLGSRGYTVLRFWNLEVKRNFYGVLTAIEDAVKSRAPLSSALSREDANEPGRRPTLLSDASGIDAASIETRP